MAQKAGGMRLRKPSMRRFVCFVLTAFMSVCLMIPTGYAEGGGPPAGTVKALAIDPSTPATVYAGTYSGGVFKSTDGGASWSAINSGLSDPNVSALACLLYTSDA